MVKEPGMSIEVARRIGASIGLVSGRLNNLCAGLARPFEMCVYIGQIDENAHCRDLGFARALHPSILTALSHHDPLAVKCHLRVHPAFRRVPHLFDEPESASEPFERGGDVPVKEATSVLVAGFAFCILSLLRL